MLPRLITWLVGWAVAVFYHVERTGPGLAPGPVLVTANHPNSLVDPLLIFHTGGRHARPLAKAPLFEQAVVGTVLRGLGGLPVYRKQDYPDQMHMNARTFDAAIEALTGGEAVQIYPEGRSHSEPSMSELRTGAARIALMTEDRAGWTLGVKVQPVGLTYEQKPFFRGRAVAAYGEPIEVASYREQYEQDERATARSLTDDIRQALLQVTLQVETTEDRELVNLAERIWVRERGEARPRERQKLSERLPRMRAFALAYARLRAEDAERAQELRAGVRRYQRMVTALGVREGDVPRRYRPSVVARYAIGQLLMLLLVLPAAIVGAFFWAPPYVLTRFVAPRFRPKHDQLATYKLAVGFFAFPSWLGMAWVASFLTTGMTGSLLVAMGAPILGFAAIAWRARQAAVREDVRVFLRVRGQPDTHDRLGELRAELVQSFDDIARRWSDDGDTGTTDPTS